MLDEIQVVGAFPGRTKLETHTILFNREWDVDTLLMHAVL